VSVDQSHYKTPDKLNARKAFYEHVVGGNRWREIVKDAVRGFDGMSLLDVGCGSGEMALFVTDGLKNVRVRGFDLSEGMVEEARRRATDAGRADMTFSVGDATAFETGETFDRVMVLHVFHLMENPRPALYRLLRLLAPAGRLVITMHSSTDMPKLKSWNRWLESQSSAKYKAGRERFTLEQNDDFLAGLPYPLHVEHIDHTIRLTNPQPFIDYINTTRDRWEPALTDEQWGAFLDHVRTEVQNEIDAEGFFDEHSVTGLIAIDIPETK